MAKKNGKKSKKKLIIFGSLGLLVVVLIVLVIFKGDKEEIISVQTEEVGKRTITQTVSAIGKINPEFQVKITPEVTGEIVSLPVKEGDVVKKGTVLIKIKSDAYEAQKERAEANLAFNKSNLASAKANLDKTLSEYNRSKELHAKKLISDAEYEIIKSAMIGAQSSYDASSASVKQSEAALKETLEQLGKTTIYAPMAGVITQLNVELGERVLGSGFSQGTDLMTVSDLSSMEARVDVDENDVVLISLDDTADVKVDAFGEKEFKGIVTHIGNSAKSSGFGTQEQVVNFEVRIRIIDVDKNLRPGMSCDADIKTETRSNVFAVPIQSVTARVEENKEEEANNDDEETVVVKKETKNNQIDEIVFIVENNKAKSVKIKTGISSDDYIEIKEGLKGGEKVVSGSYRAISRELKDGSKVKVSSKDNPFADK